MRADLLARMVALPDPGRGQRVLQSVGSIAVIVLLAIVCVYARDEGVAGNPLFQHVLPLRQAPVVATFCVIFLLGLNFGDGSILPLAWCGCLLMMPVPIALSYGQAESEQAVEEIAGYYLVYQQRPFVLLVGSCCLGVMHACLVPQPKLRRGIALAFLYGLLLNPAQTHYLTGRAEVWLSGAITCTGFTVGFGLCELGVRWHASAAPGPLQKERHSPPRHAPPPSPPTSPAPAPAGPLEGAPRAEGEIHPAVQVHPMLTSWAVRAPPAALAGQATLPPRFFVDAMRQAKVDNKMQDLKDALQTLSGFDLMGNLLEEATVRVQDVRVKYACADEKAMDAHKRGSPPSAHASDHVFECEDLMGGEMG